MGNSHEPRYQGIRGWAGDCVQLRIKTDRISHVACWYYAPKNEPAIYIDYGKDLKTPFHGGTTQLFQTDGWKMQQGAEMAFRKDDDGKGYVQEIKLPWKVITLSRKYEPGDQFNCGFELLWGEADWPVHRYADNLAEGASSREFFFYNIPAWGPVFLEPRGHLTLPTPAYVKAMQQQEAQGPVPIGYDLPEDARVTLAIDDPSGKRIRNLTAALPRSKGHNEEKWDGLDDDGKPVPPGDYHFNAIYHQTVHVNWVMSFANPGNPTWKTPDDHGSWYSDHAAPHAAAAAGDYVALGCPIGEAGSHLIGCDLTGQRLWGLMDRGGIVTAGRLSLATDGKLLWVAKDKTGSIYRVEVATGKYAPWNATARDAEGNPFQVLDLPVFDPAPQQDKDAPINLTAISLHDGTLAVCEARTGKIQLLDADTGAAKGEIAIDNPRAAAFDSDGSLVAISTDHLVRLDSKGKSTPLGDAKLDDPFGLAVDTAGKIYVSVRGEQQNVQVFDRDGKPLREIGKRGGRPSCGPFDDNAMLNPGGIAIDSRGRLWVTEEAQNPKRTSVWNTADGNLLTDFVGSTAYSGSGAINPFDPTMAFSDDTVYKIDLATGKWRPTYSLARSNDPSDLFPPTCNSHTVVLVHNAQTYVYSSEMDGMTRCMTFRDGRWRAVATVGVVSTATDRYFKPYWNPKMAGHNGEAFTWSDLNGDGLVQDDELTIDGPVLKGNRAGPVARLYIGQLPDPSGTVTLLSPTTGEILRYGITRWTSDGVPVYDAANPSVARVTGGKLGKDTQFILGGAHGRSYINEQPLTAIAADGRVLWTYPSDHVFVQGSHTATASRPGFLIGPMWVAGVAEMGGDIGELFDLNGNLGEHYIFTADGLFVQAVFKDVRGMYETPLKAVRGMSMDDTTSNGEDFGTDFLRTPDGNVYLLNGSTDARVQQVTGLETIKRFSGHFTYTPDEYAAAQQEVQEEAAKAAVPKIYTIEKVAEAPSSDSWPQLSDETKPALDISDSPQDQYARVAARYDNDNLYLAYSVKAPTNRMRNAGQDDHMLFKTGDCVDVMLQPEPAIKDQGAKRLLISVIDNHPVAVLYEQGVSGVSSKDRIPFSSPWRTIYFDRVRRLSDVTITMHPQGDGYAVNVLVPWADLGIQPASGMKLRGDVGVLFADSGGTTTVSRKYWSNKATGLVNDVPGEAMLTPSLWGEFELQ
jgi:hypothetical protein